MKTVRVAAVQAESVVLDRESTVEKASGLIAEAAGKGAKLIVFPELFIPNYVNASVWGVVSLSGRPMRKKLGYTALGRCSPVMWLFRPYERGIISKGFSV